MSSHDEIAMSGHNWLTAEGARAQGDLLGAQIAGRTASMIARIAADNPSGFVDGYNFNVSEPAEGATVTAANTMGFACRMAGLELDTTNVDTDQLTAAARAVIVSDYERFHTAKDIGRNTIHQQRTWGDHLESTREENSMQTALDIAFNEVSRTGVIFRRDGQGFINGVDVLGAAYGVAHNHSTGHGELILREADRKHGGVN